MNLLNTLFACLPLRSPWLFNFHFSFSAAGYRHQKNSWRGMPAVLQLHRQLQDTLTETWQQCRLANASSTLSTQPTIETTYANGTPQRPTCSQPATVFTRGRVARQAHKKAPAYLSQLTEAEQMFYRNSQLFEQFMHTSPLMAWVTDGDDILRYMNPVALAFHGLHKDQIGSSIHTLFGPRLSAVYEQGNQEVLLQGKAIERIEATITADGEQQVVKVFKFPIQVAGKTMVGGWATNISQQVALQDRLVKSVERHEYVNEATSDVIYDWDFTTGKLYKSPRFDELFGATASPLSIRERLRQIHPDDVARFKQIVFTALRTSEAKKWEVEYRIRTAAGHYKSVLDKAFIIRSPQAPTRVIGAIQDITSQKQLQQQLVAQEKKTKRELIKSIIETEEKERGQLSVELHDNVNQMLASCKLMLEVAKEGGSNARLLTEKTYDSIQTVISEIRKISHDLNPASLLDAGLVGAVEQLIDKINIAGKIRITLEAKTEDAAVLTEADTIAVFRIIQEQVNNILKHAQATEVSIWLQVQDHSVKLLIKDNGVGFDTANYKKGLGMRNMANRVAYYNGTLSVESSKGKGCTVYIRLNLNGKGSCNQ